jgi:hypothetical protein
MNSLFCRGWIVIGSWFLCYDVGYKTIISALYFRVAEIHKYDDWTRSMQVEDLHAGLGQGTTWGSLFNWLLRSWSYRYGRSNEGLWGQPYDYRQSPRIRFRNSDTYSVSGSLLLSVEREKVGNLILHSLSLLVQASNFLCHAEDFPSQLFLELFHMPCSWTWRSQVKELSIAHLLCTLIAVASFMASTNRNLSPLISLDISM